MSNSLATAVPMSTLDDDAWDDYMLGDYAGSERAERASMEERKHAPIEAVSDRRDMGELATAERGT
jgi:hypothetical protein